MDNSRGADAANGDTGEKRGGRGCGCWILLILFLLGGAGATSYIGAMTLLRTEKPLPGEAAIADLAQRQIAVPGEFADMRPPRKASITAAKGNELYQVECAICHGQDARGTGELGIRMYPPANDLSSNETQSKTDGQLFWMIAHGLNLTGMPAWGDKYGGPNTDDEIWSMVAFIRSLPRK